MVTKVVTGPGVEWTMTPAATMKFAKFMRRVGTIKREPASWKDMFFPEIGGSTELRIVMAGLVPAIHVFLFVRQERGCPAQGRA